MCVSVDRCPCLNPRMMFTKNFRDLFKPGFFFFRRDYVTFDLYRPHPVMATVTARYLSALHSSGSLASFRVPQLIGSPVHHLLIQPLPFTVRQYYVRLSAWVASNQCRYMLKSTIIWMYKHYASFVIPTVLPRYIKYSQECIIYIKVI